jgi:murein tripeptide amidase MpaA
LGGLTGKGGGGGGGVGLDAGDAPHAKTAAALVAGARLFLLPTMNPDGFARRRRGNVNNADLNRDFPDQFKNPGMPVGSLNPKP